MEIAGFVIKEMISKGKIYTIYRAVTREKNTPCILKIIKNIPGTKKELQREYDFLKRIDSEYVIKALDWIEDKDYVGIKMEDIEGQALHKVFKQKTLPFETLVVLALSITEGLIAVHAQGIIHKDINPANILWNPNRNWVKIIDFSISSGFSVKVSSTQRGEKLKGTLPYISPEQSGRMNHLVDMRTDLYSLGILLYEMFTGVLPFQYEHPMEMIHAHLAKIPKAPHLVNSNIPPLLSQIIMKLMAKSPDARYQSATGLLLDLKKGVDMNFSAFALGEKDCSGILRIPEKLYGREKEIATLLETYKTIGQGNILMLEGYSGAGKTSLINEIELSVTGDRGLLLRSKFDQLSGGRPYHVLVEIINQFCDMVLREEVKSFLYWKDRITNALGNMGKILISIAPAMEAIIGEQPDLPAVGEQEQQQRIYYVFQCFFKTIAAEEHPVVLFIDDLQWADLTSINLFDFLLRDKNLPYLLFIGAYRSNEVSALHPLRSLIENLSKNNSLQTIIVNNLTADHIRALVADTLGYSKDDTNSAKLAELIFEKTAGNPFFIIRLFQNLYE